MTNPSPTTTSVPSDDVREAFRLLSLNDGNADQAVAKRAVELIDHFTALSSPPQQQSPDYRCDLCDRPIPRKPMFCDTHAEYATPSSLDDIRGETIEECAKWHDKQIDILSKTIHEKKSSWARGTAFGAAINFHREAASAIRSLPLVGMKSEQK